MWKIKFSLHEFTRVIPVFEKLREMCMCKKSSGNAGGLYSRLWREIVE